MKNKFLKQFDEPHEIAGWIGMLFILTAYFLISFAYITPQDSSYQILNILGSLGIIYNTLKQKAYPSVALNVIWILIAITALLRVATL